MAISPAQREAIVAPLAARYSLVTPRSPVGGVLGQMLGNSVGNSLEFQDHRHYSPGDDPRHIDWSAFARTDQLTVRLYREEVSPRLEIIVDASASMAAHAKLDALQSLLLLLVRLADKGRAQPILWLVGDRVERVGHALAERIERLSPAGRTSLADQLAAAPLALRPRAMRVVVSDFLFPHDPDGLVRRVGDRAASLTLIQLLGRAESAPPIGPPARLIDVETGQFLDVAMDGATVRRYLDRLAALREGLSRSARRAGGMLVQAVDECSLEAICRDTLAPAGVLEVK